MYAIKWCKSRIPWYAPGRGAYLARKGNRTPRQAASLVRKINRNSTNSLAGLVRHHDSEVAVSELWKIAPQSLGELLCYPFRGRVIWQFLATFIGQGFRVY